MSTVKTGIQKVSFYDPATGTVVQFNEVLPEGEIMIRQPYNVPNSKGTMRFAGHQSKVVINVKSDATAATQLQTWMQAETPIRMATLGVEQHILWEESVPIIVLQKTSAEPGNLAVLEITMQVNGGDHSSSIMMGKNLLFIKLGWSDANSNEQPDGWTITENSGSYTHDFSSGDDHKIICDGDGTIDLKYTNLIYPIAGAALNMFVNLGGNNTESANITSVQRSYAGATLQTSAGNNGSVLSFTTPSNMYRLDIYLLPDDHAMTIGDISEISFPFLGIQSSASEVNY
jgi:hypothetical protein